LVVANRAMGDTKEALLTAVVVLCLAGAAGAVGAGAGAGAGVGTAAAACGPFSSISLQQ
jgi:hypothetical protein